MKNGSARDCRKCVHAIPAKRLILLRDWHPGRAICNFPSLHNELRQIACTIGTSRGSEMLCGRAGKWFDAAEKYY